MQPQVIPGAEPFYFPGGPTGCLVIHGFTASPQEVRWLGESLAADGHTVLGVRLAGHGTRIEDMVRSRKQDWLASVEDGYHLLKPAVDQIYAVGLSMGAVLGFHLAAQFPLAGIAAMSTPYHMPDPYFYRMRALIPFLSRFTVGKRKKPSQWFNPAGAEGRITYDRNPLRSAYELGLLLDEFQALLPSIKIPARLIHSRDDDYILPPQAEKIYANLGSPDKQLIWIQESRHVITCDGNREIVFKLVKDFINSGFVQEE